MNALLAAIVDDDANTVKALLKKDSSLATQHAAEAKLYQSGIFHWFYVGDTALHLAAAGYRVEIVGLLLAAGADPNAAANMRHSTPLHYAADGCTTCPAWNARRQVETLRCLLEEGARIDVQDMNGATPLHRAVRTRCAAAVKLLLESGANASMKNHPGSTPFHLAVQNTGRGGSGTPEAHAAQREIIETFLGIGLDPRVKNSAGKSVTDSARSTWIRELLAKGSHP
jgi:hypothetical protein